MTHPASQLDLEFLDELLDGDKEFAEELFETYRESAAASLAGLTSLVSFDQF